MILYTPLSEHDIFPVDETEYDQWKWVAIEGKMVKVQRQDDGSYEIVQFISTNPQDYLNTSYMPGRRIYLNENEGSSKRFV
ncbi:YlzJ-like protein [Melghiribacillus thermohalophilus]|uniref:YlzJ-like protein n=1 Tax=Melghiribacillus thermohalophilus TaxID=1324956 RepID=A0A4R3NHE9_9BACI|nr:YlzJ-like family protein [Melghiribacillus thermohalophilus]TCT26712.1 YlzJ-like protein [Melghiribacillus thermohalophilus]